jgi:hypothetical protein
MSLVSLLSVIFTNAAYAGAEQNCRDEIRERVLATATALTPGTSVSDFKNLKSTGKTVKTSSGETLYEYTLTDLITEDGWIPGSSAAIYVIKDSITCAVIRMHLNLR